MSSLIRREPRRAESVELFDRFDRMFDEWRHELPLRWPLFPSRGTAVGTIPVDEYQDDDGVLVVRK